MGGGWIIIIIIIFTNLKQQYPLNLRNKDTNHLVFVNNSAINKDSIITANFDFNIMTANDSLYLLENHSNN